MHVPVDKQKVSRAFARQAGEYDRHALVQKRVVSSLENLVAAGCSEAPSRLLDIGCGTGSLLSLLRRRFPLAKCCGLDLAHSMARLGSARLGGEATLVNGDVERLPFGDGTFDLLVSSSTFQWVQSLETCFSECRRVLAPGGSLYVAFFGQGSLHELQESYRAALTVHGRGTELAERLHRFRSLQEVKRVLATLDFEQVVLRSETEVEYHPDVASVLRSIKAVGAATPAAVGSGRGLGWRGLLNEMAGTYRSRFGTGSGIPATYDVFYIVARKAQ